MIINSINNSKIKRINALKTKKGRKEYGQFCIEGVNILKDLNPNKISIIELFISLSAYEKLKFLEEVLNRKATIVADAIFDRISDTKSPSGVLAIANLIVENESISGDTIVLLDNISDAGNMGTILRTAVARNVETVLLYGDCVDVFSPKVVRASMGGLFNINIKKVNSCQLDKLLNEFSLIGLDVQGESIYNFKRNEKLILAVGNEAHGLSADIKDKCHKFVCLPMSDKIESLNAAISISVALFMI